MSFMERIEHYWDHVKLPLGALVVGLLVGPFISNMAGWQVTQSAMQENVEEAVIQVKAEMCNYFARQQVPNTAALDYQRRQDLAEKFAKLPWEEDASYAVESDCTGMLAEKPASADKQAT